MLPVEYTRAFLLFIQVIRQNWRHFVDEARDRARNVTPSLYLASQIKSERKCSSSAIYTVTIDSLQCAV